MSHMIPNIITFNEWLTLKQYGNITKGFRGFMNEELDMSVVFFNEDLEFIDYLERQKVEDITPAFVLLPRFFWEDQKDKLPTDFLPNLKIVERLEELSTKRDYWMTLQNRALAEIDLLKCKAIPRKEQEPIIDFFMKEIQEHQRIRGVFQAAPGFGKAQPNSEPILTPNGWTNMGEIKEGNFVIGKDGNKTKVLGVFPQGERKVYKITFTDGTSVKCDKEHIWSVWKNSCNVSKMYTNMTTEEMLNYHCGYYHMEKTKYGTEQKNRRWSVPLCDPINYEKKDEPILDGYVLGLLLGDGGLTSGAVILSDKPANNFKRLKSILDKDFNDFSHRVCDGKEYYLKSRKLKKELDKLNLRYKYSHQKFIPEIYLKGSINTRQKVLWGLLDTDAYKPHDIHKEKLNRYSYEYGTTSPQLIKDFVELCQSLGIYTNPIRLNKEPTYTYKGEKKIGRPYYSTVINLRKKRKSIDLIEELDYQEESTCIKVEAEDSLYITSGYTVTHNTAVSIMLASRFRAKTLVVVPNQVLQDQWIDAILEFTDLTEENIGIIQGSDIDKIERDIFSLEHMDTKVIYIVKIQSLFSQIKHNHFSRIQQMYQRVDLVIFDEAHNTGSATSYAKTSSLFLTPNILGLTATPYRQGLNDFLLRTSIGETIYTAEHQNLVPDVEIHNVWTEFTDKEKARLVSAMGDYIIFLGVFNSLMRGKPGYFNYLADTVAWNLSNDHNVVVLFPTIHMQETLQKAIEIRHPSIIKEVLLLKGKTKQDAMEMVKIERRHLMKDYKDYKEAQDVKVKAKEIKRKEANELNKTKRAEVDARIEFLKEHALDLYKRQVKESNVIISNYNLLSAGFDKSKLSNIIFGGAPRIGKISVIQSIGRITRIHEGKKQPLVQYFIPSQFLLMQKSTRVILNKNIRVQYPDAKFKYIGFEDG